LPINSYVTLVLAWIIFGVLHSVLAYQPLKNRLEKRLKAKYKFYRLVYSIFAFIGLALVVWCHISIVSNLLWQPPLLQKIIAGLLVVISGGLMLLCMKKYFADLSGIDAVMGKKGNFHLQTTGINALVRHPLYTVTIAFVWSLFLWQPLLSNLLSCICITLYTRIGIYFEEMKLTKLFGKDYQLYQASVPMLIPKL
jgi:protein-S-isoprenylcysteine O-methyltransferase Ste14